MDEPDNERLEDVVRLLRDEVERLELQLDNQRLLDHPQKDAIVRDLIRTIDARQDRLDELLALIRARDGAGDGQTDAQDAGNASAEPPRPADESVDSPSR